MSLTVCAAPAARFKPVACCRRARQSQRAKQSEPPSPRSQPPRFTPGGLLLSYIRGFPSFVERLS